MARGHKDPIQSLVVVLLFVGCCSSSLGLYDKSDSVVELTAKNFASLIEDTNLVSVVEFYAPWCGHCQALAPSFKKAAEKLEVRFLLRSVTLGSVQLSVEIRSPVL